MTNETKKKQDILAPITVARRIAAEEECRPTELLRISKAAHRILRAPLAVERWVLGEELLGHPEGKKTSHHVSQMSRERASTD